MRYRRVLITGASSGLGRALALALAEPGAVLQLGGRDTARLASVASECRALGAAAHAHAIDVCDAATMAAWVAAAAPLDLVIANAGISAGTGHGAPEMAAQAREIFAVNLGGALNTMLPALEAMRHQQPDTHGVRGRIAAIASLAAFLASPVTPSYAASKAALDAWTVATAVPARRHGVWLTSVCPGFIRTPMTAANRFPMPGLMDAERAARIILRGIARGRRRIAFPWSLALATRILDLLPPRLLGPLLAGAGSKPER